MILLHFICKATIFQRNLRDARQGKVARLQVHARTQPASASTLHERNSTERLDNRNIDRKKPDATAISQKAQQAFCPRYKPDIKTQTR